MKQLKSHLRFFFPLGQNATEVKSRISSFSLPCTSSSRQYSGIPAGISFLSGNSFLFRVNKPFCSPSPAQHPHVQAACRRHPDRPLWVCGLLGATCLKG